MYNDNKITGYTANGMDYNLEKQKNYAKQIGIQNYMNEFSIWFQTETNGSCSIKEK